MYWETNVDNLVRPSSLDLVVDALHLGVFSVDDLIEATRRADSGGAGYGGGLKAERGNQNVQFKDGDWICEKCGNLNFARRTECHSDNCKAPRPSRGASQRGRGRGSGSGQSRPGDWNCAKCGNLNFAFRNECHRDSCKEPRSSRDEGSMNGSAGVNAGGFAQVQDGDWTCDKCEYVNFARRTECNQCKAPRSGGSMRSARNSARGYGPARGGDWNCMCGYVNFARRTECNECKAPRTDGTEGSTRGGLFNPYGK